MMNAILLAWPFDDVLVNASLALLIVLSLATVLASVNTFRVEVASGIMTKQRIQRFVVLGACAFVALFVAIASQNFLTAWIALEVITVILALAVLLNQHQASAASAMHFVKRVAPGTILGVIGVILLVKSALSVGVPFSSAVLYDGVGNAAGTLPAPMVTIAFVLMFFSLATKIGLAPFHTWAPETYSKISSPFAGLLAAMVPFASFLVLLRMKHIVDLMLVDAGKWSGQFLLVFGALSVVVSAVMLFRQKNYKRTAAMFGLHHAGVTVFLTGLGPAGLIPAMIHAFSAALLTLGGFVGSGVLHGTYKTSKFSGVHESIRLLPFSSGLGITLFFAALAVPFSPFFTSELVGFGYGIQEHLVLTIIVILAVLAGCIFLGANALCILLKTDEPVVMTGPVPSWALAHGVLALCALITIGLGVFVSTESGIRFVITLVEGVGGL